MKRILFFAFVFCAVLFAALALGCSNGSTDSSKDGDIDDVPSTLPDNWRTMDAGDWDAWADAEGFELSRAEQDELIEFFKEHGDKLSKEGQEWWENTFRNLRSTNKNPVNDDVDLSYKTIIGLSYLNRADTEIGCHFLLDVSYEEALEAFTDYFGFEPGTDYNIKENSSLSGGTDWVIFEEADSSFRLVKSVDGVHLGVGWQKMN